MPRPSYSEQEGTTKRTPRKKKRFSIATRDEQTKRNETKRKSKNWDKETGRRTKEARENPNGKTGKKTRGIVYRNPDGTTGWTKLRPVVTTPKTNPTPERNERIHTNPESTTCRTRTKMKEPKKNPRSVHQKRKTADPKPHRHQRPRRRSQDE
jgi:hypothetical protein